MLVTKIKRWHLEKIKEKKGNTMAKEEIQLTKVATKSSFN